MNKLNPDDIAGWLQFRKNECGIPGKVYFKEGDNIVMEKRSPTWYFVYDKLNNPDYLLEEQAEGLGVILYKKRKHG
jgi:hypothetical protein